MNWLDEFFKNPNWISALVIIAYLIADKLITNSRQKNEKKEQAEMQKKEKQKQQQSFQTLDRLADAVELFCFNPCCSGIYV